MEVNLISYRCNYAAFDSCLNKLLQSISIDNSSQTCLLMSTTVFRDLEARENCYIKCLFLRFSTYATENLERKLKMEDLVRAMDSIWYASLPGV